MPLSSRAEAVTPSLAKAPIGPYKRPGQSGTPAPWGLSEMPPSLPLLLPFSAVPIIVLETMQLWACALQGGPAKGRFTVRTMSRRGLWDQEAGRSSTSPGSVFSCPVRNRLEALCLLQDFRASPWVCV